MVTVTYRGYVDGCGDVHVCECAAQFVCESESAGQRGAK